MGSLRGDPGPRSNTELDAYIRQRLREGKVASVIHAMIKEALE